MNWLVVGLALVILLLQYRIWLSEDGVRDLDRLRRAVAAQRSSNDQLAERNRQLAAEVRDLKTGLAALEERARSALGMIASHETFYQVVPPSSPVPTGSPAPASPPARSSTRTAAAH